MRLVYSDLSMLVLPYSNSPNHQIYYDYDYDYNYDYYDNHLIIRNTILKNYMTILTSINLSSSE